MMKRIGAVTLTLAFLLLFISGLQPQLVNLATANPYNWLGEVPPDATTKPPSITILSPENNKTYNANISLNLNVTVGESKTASRKGIDRVYYKPDWEKKNITLTTYPVALNLTGVPEGNHSITIYAFEWGDYPVGGAEYIINNFWIENSAIVNFTIDASPPVISVLSPEDKKYAQSDILLDLTINEQVSQIQYSLDGERNITKAKSNTLTGLPNGYHNLTVYATDDAGNVGVSKTINFTVEVPESYPTLLIATASGASVAGAGLFIYFRKRKH
jgi:hypothetical protein